MTEAKKIAIILIRGRIGFRQEVKDTLDMLHLGKKHACTVIDETPTNKGMINKVKDAVTWGPVTEETIKLLEEKRGTGKKVYHLHPPRGGFERKGIKVSYNKSGALGDRKENINELIKKML